MAVKKQAAKKRSLGRGLEALLGVAAKPVTPASEQAGHHIHTLPVDVMQRGKYQPRTDMHPESLEELAVSIRAQGIVQPIVVRPIGKDRYEIIAGERRWRAAQMASLQDVPVVVRDVPDEAAIAMALIENIQRENLNPMEEAVALRRLIEEFEMTHAQAADAVGRSRAAVSNLLRLLDLSGETKTLLEHGDLEMGHARALLALHGDAQAEAARQVVARGLSVRETEVLVRHLQAGSGRKGHDGKVLDPNIQRLQDDLSERIGAPVRVQHTSKGKGKLVIQYSSLDELDGILERIR